MVIEDFFAAEEIAPIYADYQAQYGVQGQGDGKALDVKPAGSVGASHRKQFMNVDILPYQGSVAMNMISLNPEVDRSGKKVVRR